MRQKIIAITCLVVTAILGGYLLNDYLNRNVNDPSYSAGFATASSANTRPVPSPKSILVSGLEKSSKLITSEMDMICDIAVNDSWTNFSIFSKEQIFTFKGNAAYMTDLAGISSDDLQTDDEAYTVTIYIDEPSVYNIYIDPESIQTKEIRNGLLRFGEVSLGEEDIKTLLITAEEQMRSAATDSENMIKARENTTLSVTELLSEILTNAGITGYKIIVNYK